jgi:flagellar basal-body rod protein FlgB
MLDKMTQRLDFHGNALLLRSERQRAIASNIANADTPGYVARDFKFADAMRAASEAQAPGAMRQQSVSDPRHIPLPAAGSGTSDSALGYSLQTQPSLDNAVRYEATLRFINGGAKTMLSAIQGQ